MPHRGRVEVAPPGEGEVDSGAGEPALREPESAGGGERDPARKDQPGGPARGPRRLGREMAVQMLYQHDLAGSSPAQIFNAFDVGDFRAEAAATAGGDEPVEARLERESVAFEYAVRLVAGTLEHLAEIDGWLREQAENWRLERMSRVDRNILRLAIYELAFEEDVPKIVVLDEAIELAKKYGSEQSGSFVNGLLDALLRERHFPGRMT
jgi:N utilization substance protein B